MKQKKFDDKRQGMRENELRLMYKNTVKINTLAMCNFKEYGTNQKNNRRKSRQPWCI